MTRTVDEWRGKSDDEAVPERVRTRVWLRAGGHCQHCTRKIAAGERWVCDHVKALINGGPNRESNLRVLCDWCDRKVKTPADVAIKSKTARVRGKHIGARQASARPVAGSKASGWRKRMDGRVERRP